MPDETNSRNPARYSRIGKYDILSHIATGGVCAVYRALDTELDREVALKILPPSMAQNPDTLERFRREARHASRLTPHENIVRIYEFGESAGTFFLALEFVEGIDLLTHINERGKLDPDETVPLLFQAARALEHLHKSRVVHRDIKPGNFLLSKRPDGWQLKLTDLGLARLHNDEDFRITKDGYTVGTLDYMSPEQARDSGSVDIRSDIYALGCTWYHMLAGRPPFGEGSLSERLLRHFESPPPDIRQFNPKVPPSMLSVLLRMLAKRAHERYRDPTELLLHIERLGKQAVLPVPPGVAAQSVTDSQLEHAPAERDPVRPDTETELKASETVLSGVLQISGEQREAAAGQFARAKEVIASGNLEYGIHLLLSCCKIDVANLVYRRVLRRAAVARFKADRKGGALSFLAVSREKTRLKTAKAAGDHIRVLNAGEELLARNPYDIAVQLDMAEAAEALGATELALWILRHAYDKKLPDLRVARALARLYENHGRLKEAITFWEVIRAADPLDMEAAQKRNDLAAAETIARGEYGKDIGR